MDRGDRPRQAIECVEPELPIGAAFAVERIRGHALRVGSYQPEGGRRVDMRDRCGGYAFVTQRAQQALAEEAARQGAEERHRLRQPRQPHGDIERRAADSRIERHSGGRVAAGKHIHQRLSADDEHSCSLTERELTAQGRV